jgi:ribonuclease D
VAINYTPPPYGLIEDDATWKRALDCFRAAFRRRPHLGIDIESDGFFRYPEKTCLIQLGADNEVAILDPLSVRDISALGEIMADPSIQKIFHGCDHDLRSLNRDYGFTAENIFDSHVAIQMFTPEAPGLGNAIKAYLGVELPKPVKIQRSDWSQRPLSDEALDYAAGDSAYLLPLRDLIQAELDEKGRSSWAQEEFSILSKIRYVPPPPIEEDCLDAKGTYDLSPQELAIYREIYIFRDSEARKLGRPPFKVVSNDFLLELARNPRTNPRDIHGVSERWLGTAWRGLEAALARGMKAEPVIHPSRYRHTPNPWRDDSSARFSRLKEVRGVKATELNIRPSTLWPGTALEKLALDPGILEQELTGTSQYGVRNWQREVFGGEIRRTLEEMSKGR